MKRSKSMYAISILTTAVGVGLLRNAMGLPPDIDWFWTFGLPAARCLPDAPEERQE